MVEKFHQSLFRLIDAKDRVLLAVSGGMDSTLLIYLMKEVGLKFSIAHCNFQLRGKSSDEDEAFVRRLADKCNVECYVQHFDTPQIQANEKGSVQMLARDLRYDWLENIRKEKGYQWIVTAHHLNDSLETILYNFTKGSGIKGLKGIPSKNGFVIRPLLNFSKDEIQNYIVTNKIEYREDVTNTQDKYARNKIRLNVIPELKKINPSLEKTTLRNIEIVKETDLFLQYFLVQIKNEILEENEFGIKIHKEKLEKYPFQKLILFEILKPYHFNADQIENLINFKNDHSGGMLHSSTHRLVNDREFFLLTKNKENELDHILIPNIEKEIEVTDCFLSLEIVDQKEVNYNDKNVAYLDLNLLDFPLELRRKKDGDIFFPLGMNGQQKKVKKLFTDLKLSIPEKENTWLLTSSGKICWLVGLRLDERFKITAKTKTILKVSYQKKNS